jgi:hypothetical protein
MNIEVLIREMNPVSADDVEIDAVRIRELLEQMLEKPSRRVKHVRRSVVASVLVGLAISIVIATQTLPGTLSRPTSAAAAELQRLAGVAQSSDEAPIVLGPGQYLYSEVRTLQGAGFFVGNHPASDQFDVTYVKTVQEWQGADGSGRELVTYNSSPQFTTPASRAGWVASGKPSIAPPTNYPGGRAESTWSSAESKFAIPLLDESALPTNPVQLQHLIVNGGPSLPEALVANIDTTKTPAGVFGAAAEILSTPATGSSPALRSALFKVMANVPGVQLLGSATDRTGRTGVELAAPQKGDGGELTEIIIDPSTGEILQTETVLNDPSQWSSKVQKYFGDTKGEVIAWTDYLGLGVAHSTSAVPEHNATEGH